MSEQAEGAVTESGESGGGEGDGAGLGSLDKLTSAFDTFKGDVTSRFDALAARIPEREAEEQVEDDGGPEFEFDFDDEDYAEDGDLTPEAQMRALQQMMTQVAQEQMRPHLEAQQADRRAQEADSLEEKYPALREDKFQDEMIAKTIEFARRIGAPALAQEPQLLEMVYLAHEAQKRAGDEIPAGSQQDVTLERTGAAGAGAGEEDDGDKIVAAMSARKFRVS